MSFNIIVIVGPTAAGKTNLSLEIAKKLNCEIVSADSMQIYKYMNIGTAKPTKQEMQGIPHHLLDCVLPNENYSVAQFQAEAKKAIFDIENRNKIPLIVGGTGLYVNSLTQNLTFTEAKTDYSYRKELQKLCETHGKEVLMDKLREIDPDTAQRLHLNDTRRIIRALEIYHITGRTMSSFKEDIYKNIPYNVIMIGLNMDRKKLYNRINNRVDIMIKNGLVEEVKTLLDSGYNKDMTSMQGLGYKELIDYINGLCPLNEAIELVKRDTRRFAKRQLTWFRRDKRIKWFDLDKYCNSTILLKDVLHYLNEEISSFNNN